MLGVWIQLEGHGGQRMFLNIFANSSEFYRGFNPNAGQNVSSTYARKLEDLWRFNGAILSVSEDQIFA